MSDRINIESKRIYHEPVKGATIVTYGPRKPKAKKSEKSTGEKLSQSNAREQAKREKAQKKLEEKKLKLWESDLEKNKKECNKRIKDLTRALEKCTDPNKIKASNEDLEDAAIRESYYISIEKYDKDHNGQLNKEEAAALANANQDNKTLKNINENFEKYANGDQQLNVNEFLKFVKDNKAAQQPTETATAEKAETKEEIETKTAKEPSRINRFFTGLFGKKDKANASQKAMKIAVAKPAPSELNNTVGEGIGIEIKEPQTVEREDLELPTTETKQEEAPKPAEVKAEPAQETAKDAPPEEVTISPIPDESEIFEGIEHSKRADELVQLFSKIPGSENLTEVELSDALNSQIIPALNKHLTNYFTPEQLKSYAGEDKLFSIQELDNILTGNEWESFLTDVTNAVKKLNSNKK